jgi:predicted N-acyltransferase
MAVEVFHDEEEKELMNQYGITSEAKTVFHFQEHKYDRLEDAVSYAKKLRVIENDN